MGKTAIAMILLLLAMIPAAAFSQDLEKARIGYMQGDVQISTKDNTEEWFPAAVNTPLREGDRIWVPEGGRSEVQVSGGVAVRLDEVTSFDILSLGEESVQAYLNGGRAYVNNRSNGVEYVQVDTPLSSIGCYDNSIVMIGVSESGAAEISVLSGEASAETRNGKIRIPAGNTLRIGENLAAEFHPLDPADEWQEWNSGRDRKFFAASQSLSYLPDELDDYVSDFDDNGRWIYASDYGYVWSPAAAYSIDWAPYRIGRWIWMAGEYVWISGEHWGWAPYHYGRWIHLRNAGWCWVPPRRGQARWSPGYVGWVHTPTYVSWVPLAPGETYYGHRDYGPGSVNVSGRSAGLAGINLNFRNMNIRNAVTVQHRDTFLTGKKTSFRMSENPFTRKDVSVGPPTFKPQRATLSPAIKTIPRTQLPPERVRFTTVQNLKKQRGVVPDQKGSVFTPGRTAREMPVMKRQEPGRLQSGRSPENLTEIRRKSRQPVLQPQSRGFEMKREKTPQPPVRVQTPQPTRAVPAGPSQPRVQAPQTVPAPAARQPAAPSRQLRSRPAMPAVPATPAQPAAPSQQFRSQPATPATPAVPAQPQGRPARIERQLPKAQPADTIRQPAAQPQTRSLEMKRERTPQPPVRVQTPQPTRAVPAVPAQPRAHSPQTVPAPAARQPAAPSQQLRSRPATPATPATPAQPAAPSQQFRSRPATPATPAVPAQPQGRPARIERQQAQQPRVETIQADKPRIEKPVVRPESTVNKEKTGTTQDSPGQGGQPAAKPGRQIRQGAGWRQ